MRNKAWISGVLLLLASFASCAPWTVRPIGAAGEAPAGSEVNVPPAQYVDSIWSSRLLPALTDSAADARELLNALAVSPAGARTRYGHHQPNGPYYFIVKGRGIVTAVDTRSRVGLALVDIAPFDRRPDVSIQIGPVLRGASLRDAPGIVHFSDFVNQLQFADVGIELNNRVLKNVLEPLKRSRLKGQTVSFTGTLPVEEKSEPPLAGLIPAVLTVEGSR
ncbi:MAG: DUF2291 domain-containing protein [Bryobacterales bacterium]|nr:DUF2291 domain-containing protein [Bryobacterales bacterium]